jgi:hypothetical protein
VVLADVPGAACCLGELLDVLLLLARSGHCLCLASILLLITTPKSLAACGIICRKDITSRECLQPCLRRRPDKISTPPQMVS